MERIGEKGRIHGHLLKSAVSLFFCVFGVDCNDTVKKTILSGSPAKKITDLEARISNLEKQKDNIVEPRVSGIVSKEDCEKKYASITKEIEMAKGELDRHQDRKRECGREKKNAGTMSKMFLSICQLLKPARRLSSLQRMMH